MVTRARKQKGRRTDRPAPLAGSPPPRLRSRLEVGEDRVEAAQPRHLDRLELHAEEARQRERAQERAQALHEQGMPFQMALAVAHGRLDLNEALERMARNDRILRLMKKHDLSRALATQVALGQADLDRVLLVFKLIIDGDDLASVIALEDPDQGAVKRLTWSIRQVAPEALTVKICRDKFARADWESLGAPELLQLLMTVKRVVQRQEIRAAAVASLSNEES